MATSLKIRTAWGEQTDFLFAVVLPISKSRSQEIRLLAAYNNSISRVTEEWERGVSEDNERQLP